MSAVQQQDRAAHAAEAEKILKAKIYLLQDQMTNFKKELHQTVDSVEKGNILLPENSFGLGAWLSAGMTSAKKAVCGSLCLLVCMTWPLLFPLWIYFMEGVTFLFWKSLCLAVLYMAAFTIKFVTELKEITVKLIPNVLLEIKMQCSKYYKKMANLTVLPLLQITVMADSPCHPSKDSNFDTFDMLYSGAGCIAVVALCGAAVLITVKTNTEYFPSIMIFLAGCISGLILMHLKKQKSPLLPNASGRSYKNLTLPCVTSWCSEGCTKLCCHAATSNFNKINVPRTPPPSYREALLSSSSPNFESGARRSLTL